MTRVILVRHGQTKWNFPGEERFRGSGADLELDETGIRQAQAAGRSIAARWRISAIYASPLKRALATAHIIGKAVGAEPIVQSGLIDINYGEWQGFTLQEVREGKHGPSGPLWFESPDEVQIPGGESLGVVRERAVRALEETMTRHRDVNIALVSHQAVCRLVLCHALGLDNSAFWRLGQSVCAINVIEERSRHLVVTLLNDICHLADN
ncbi:MAG: histidine phosphatase family protein [Chloroflexi bacterium]|nr:histidine phosphatase family protein [Chloroflexota bacterium]